MRIPSRFRIMSASFALALVVIGLAIFSTSLMTGHAAGTGSSTNSKVSMRPQATSTATNNCGYWKSAASTNVPSTNDYFNSSTVLAINGGELVTHVWAVGYYTDSSTGDAQTLIEHRHGTTWTVIPSPNPGVNNILTSVMAITSTDVWAVGYSYTTDPGVDGQTLILNWDGTSWNIFSSPNPGTANTLNALIQT